MWEVVDTNPYQTLRMQVPGGWLYLVSTSARETMCFVPAQSQNLTPYWLPFHPAPYPNATVAPR